MRTSRAAALAVVMLVTVGAAAGYAVHHRQHHHLTPIAARSPVPVPVTPPPRDPVLPDLDPSAPAPTASAVKAELAAATRRLTKGAHLVGEVIDAQTGAVLWSRDDTHPEPPASTTKLLTAVAALVALGPDHRLQTTTRRIGHTVYLIGGGDPTIVRNSSSLVSPNYPQPATLSDLARQTARSLGSITRVRLRLDAGAWSGPRLAKGWKPSYITEGDLTPPSALELDGGRIDPDSDSAARTETPVAQAGAAFKQLLKADGVTVTGPIRTGQAGLGGTPLGSVSSPTVAQLVQRMLTVSDDDLAEALGRAVALHDGRVATFANAGAAVRSEVASLGIPVTGVSLQDTSGLSHLDRVTPRTLVALLRAASSDADPELRPVIEGLPVAGLTGTLSDRYLTSPTDAAAGLLRAKTGTLTGVNALAGTVVDASGRLLIFALLASDAPSPGLTVPALDVLASRLSRCGCVQ